MQTSHRGFRVFLLVWIGQLVSVTGSAMTDFALGIFVYQRTGSVTQFAFVLIFRTLPVLLLSPLAGALVDRWSKRTVMLVWDVVGALTSTLLAALFFSGQLHIEYIYAAAVISAVVNSFQVPAYLAAITSLVSAKELGRTSGMVQVAQACAEIVSPLLAGMLVAIIQMQGILLIDAATFVISIVTLILARFPVVQSTKNGEDTSLSHEIWNGVTYIFQRPSLVALLLFFAMVYFQGAVISVLIEPLVLAFAPPSILGAILTAGGSGLFLGGIILSAWGGPRQRINGILGFAFLLGVGFILLGLRPAPVLIALGAFSAHFCLPFINGCNQAIWQSKVPLSIQGRVFAIRQVVTRAAQPIAFLLAGPLTDRIFNPLLMENGLLASTLGPILGVGAGRGIALLFLLMGGLSMITAGIGWLSLPIRQIEARLPDASS